MTRRHVVVAGRVQGVGFRWFTKKTADSLGLAGWVRNREDGSVEAEAQGSDASLDQFVAALKSGNPAARVDRIETQPAPVKDEKNFRII